MKKLIGILAIIIGDILQKRVDGQNKLTVPLWQIYGELNRLRLILGEKSKRGQKIEKFDAEHNYYIPFAESEKLMEKYNEKYGVTKFKKAGIIKK